ncbi:chromate resistance protein [Paenibacillus filicis]|uniref:Chromate resistance protein n=1 Tax=Paenibacillus gyeongsangnamensis TaxID=3388067 RepID=A0ABT4QDX9_9BACL|nr:chromate resistance protein ChrB domain-containing protein [Paenibacillus filicis]MCZ8515070.1 chromate resistance protein [Paenibacillus filicis]
MKWVTWENVGVDRMACAWLIKRFVDHEAEFLFVPSGDKLPEDAEPFDIPGVRYTHRRGHCTFHTMIKEFEIKDPVLMRLARIVDEADTVQEVLVEPAAPGMDLICRGIRSISASDEKALETGYIMYEALYAEIAKEMKN